jgi:hypothetical protein
MGYRLLSQEDGASLPHNGGALGMDIERAQHITDDGLAFDIIRGKQVRPGSPGEQAQRLVATVGQPGRAAPAGLSTGTKIAIGVGAAALFGCYELGCFSHRARPQGQGVGQQQRQP